MTDFLDMDALAAANPTFPELPALAAAGDTPQALACSTTGPGTVPPPPPPPMPITARFTALTVSYNTNEIIAEVQASRSSLSGVTIALLQGTTTLAAATLAYLILLQRDAVALHVFDTEMRETMTRTDNIAKIHSIMDRLAGFQATQQTRLGSALSDIARMTKARGIVVVISDLFDDEEAFEKGVQQIRFGGSEVVVFQVMDPYELEFPFEGIVEFIGLEETLRMKTNPAAIRKSYLESMNAFRQRVRGICDRSGSHYVLANTRLPLGEMLSGYLAFRHKVAAR